MPAMLESIVQSGANPSDPQIPRFPAKMAFLNPSFELPARFSWVLATEILGNIATYIPTRPMHISAKGGLVLIKTTVAGRCRLYQ